jgi:hypothetical protein
MTDAPAAGHGRRGLGMASVILGIMAVGSALVEPTLAFIFGLAGLYLGLLAKGGLFRALAMSGLVLNAVALLGLLTLLIAGNLIH